MINETLNYLKDLLHAQLCYQFFITPLHLPLNKQYREFANKACEYFEGKRSEVIHQDKPRHHVLHRFTPSKESNGKKILITHGWMSRAAYMCRLIRVLHLQGFELYALDFPAHGDAKGAQLPWPDAVKIIRNTINQYGPFYGVIGHSYGGSMLLNTLNLAGQSPKWELACTPQRAIMIASPVRMRTPVQLIARRFKLNAAGYLHLRQLFRQQVEIDPKLVHLRQFISQTPNIPFLCIHGELDHTISPKESILFCNQYEHARLSLLPDADHISVLMDERVERLVCDFLN